MLDRLKKRFATILITLAILMSTGIVAYALVSYITTATQTSSFTKKEYFEMECSEIFSGTSEVGPGDTVSTNPTITSESSVDIYVFIKVEMPVFNDAGLYELAVNDSWSMVERSESNGTWVEVYRYNEPLAPDESTTSLAGKLTMKNITLAEYADIEDINVSMTGFACRTADVTDIDEAWSFIKSEAGM